MMYSRFSDNLLVKLLGVWEPREGMYTQPSHNHTSQLDSLVTDQNRQRSTLRKLWHCLLCKFISHRVFDDQKLGIEKGC